MINFYKTINGYICQTPVYEANCWVNVIDPTDEEISELQEKFNVDYDYIRSSLDEEESSHIETENDTTFLIFDAPCVE